MSEVGVDRQEVAVAYDAQDLRSLYGACRKCRRLLFFIAFLPLLIGLFGYLDSPTWEVPIVEVISDMVLGAALAGAVYYFSPALQIWQRRKNGWDQPVMVQLTADGVATRHPVQDTQFHWSAIKDVVVRKDRLFLFTTPACAIILPRRSFDSDAQFNEWAGRAKEYFDAARPPKVV